MTQQPSRPRKRLGRPPTGKGVTIGTRLQLPFLKALDEYIAQHGGTLTRAGAIRAILAERFGLRDESDPSRRP